MMAKTLNAPFQDITEQIIAAVRKRRLKIEPLEAGSAHGSIIIRWQDGRVTYTEITAGHKE